jgi:transcriptional antiterminator RfaH
MWYAVYSKPREERKALEHLSRQGFETFLPLINLEKVVRGRLKVVTEPMFSRYLFVKVESQNQNFSTIRSTQGVSQLVSFGPHPAQISDALVGALRLVHDEHSGVSTPLIKHGDSVLVTDGPLKGMRGIFQEPDGQKRAFILIEMLSQHHTVAIDRTLLAPSPAW